MPRSDKDETWIGFTTDWYSGEPEEPSPSAKPRALPSEKEFEVPDKNAHLKRYDKKHKHDDPAHENGIQRKRVWSVADHHSTSNPLVIAEAQRLGRGLADHDFDLMYDGVHTGINAIIADSLTDEDGRVAAIVLSGQVPSNLPSQAQVVEAASAMHRRNAMLRLSDAFVVVPGGLSVIRLTLDLIHLIENKAHDKPIGLLNIDGFFDSFIKFADEMCEKQLIGGETRDKVFYASENQRVDPGIGVANGIAAIELNLAC